MFCQMSPLAQQFHPLNHPYVLITSSFKLRLRTFLGRCHWSPTFWKKLCRKLRDKSMDNKGYPSMIFRSKRPLSLDEFKDEFVDQAKTSEKEPWKTMTHEELRTHEPAILHEQRGLAKEIPCHGPEEDAEPLGWRGKEKIILYPIKCVIKYLIKCITRIPQKKKVLEESIS